MTFPIPVQRNYWQVYRNDKPGKNTTKVPSDMFLAIGYEYKQCGGVCACVWKHIWQKCRMRWHAFQRSPTNSIQPTSSKNGVPHAMVHTRLRLSRRWNQAIGHTDRTLLLIYYINVEPGYIPNILFSDKAISPLWEKSGSWEVLPSTMRWSKIALKWTFGVA
jgi:hypothetical protein